MDYEMELMDIDVDTVLCIDGSKRMADVLDKVKENATRFINRMAEIGKECGKHIRQQRVKVIVFRSVEHDGDKAIEESRFFILPQENEEFNEFIIGIEAEGGGDSQDGWDAISRAVMSQWSNEWYKRRHVVMLWTNSPTNDLGTNPSEGAPKNHYELFEKWEKYEPPSELTFTGRLCVFSPKDDSWKKIEEYPRTVWINKQSLDEKDKKVMEDVVCGIILFAI